MPSPFSQEHIHSILQQWDIDPTIHASQHQGLINHTLLVGQPTKGVLQWVNPIFDPRIHHDIEALTHHLNTKNMTTPRLMPTKTGALYVEEPSDGYWRMLSFVKGKTFDQVTSPALAFEAGKLVGRFHNALHDFDHSWQAPFRDAHNTQQRMDSLSAALEQCEHHALYTEAQKLGTQILTDWKRWSGNTTLPTRTIHGDLKISNLHFTESEQGYCLLDLDTIGPGDYSIEMGDAWRSWCNPAGESNPEAAHFDIELFEASAKGWFSSVGDITIEESESLALGIHRICLELSARFCADALFNNYFKEDLSQFPMVGTHNLHRARTQFNLAQSVQRQLSEAERIIRTVR